MSGIDEGSGYDQVVRDVDELWESSDGLPSVRDHVEAMLEGTEKYQKPPGNLHIKFVPQDCWIGLYWKTEQRPGPDTVYGNRIWLTRTYYLCLIPCFPIIWRRYQQWER